MNDYLCYLAGLLLVFVSLRLLKSFWLLWRLRNIPTVGFPGLLASYLGSIEYLGHAKDLLQEGFQKFRGRAFKIRVGVFGRWQVVVSGPAMIDELKRAPDDVLSSPHAIFELFQLGYTLGWKMGLRDYHIDALRGPATRNIGTFFEELKDEVAAVFTDEIPPTQDWHSLPAFDTVMKIVFRVGNRPLVGLPLCRDEQFFKVVSQLVLDAGFHGPIINQCPSFLQPLVARCLTNQPKLMRQAIQNLGPSVQYRLDEEARHGKHIWPGRPNDLLSWLLDAAPLHERTVYHIVLRILVIEFAALQTTSFAFTHTLINLAGRPEYVNPLREEVESVITADGWNKSSMNKMYKLDSFIKECSRFDGTSGLTVIRKAMKDFTFSDGTFIPKGTSVAAATHAIHHDNASYGNASEFQPFRFAEMRDSGGEGTKYQMVTINKDWLLFGQGNRACPGRFFAVSEMKALMVYVLTHYDLKLPQKEIPQPRWTAEATYPDPAAKILFRVRDKSSLLA